MKQRLKLFGSLLCGLFFVFACSTQPERPTPVVIIKPTQPKAATPTAVKEFASAKAAYDSHQFKKALPLLKRFAQKNPGSDLTDEAAFLMGQIYYDGQQFQDAAAEYMQVINAHHGSPFESEVILRASRSLLRLQRASEVEPILNQINVSHLSPTQTLEEKKIRIETYVALRDNMAALTVYNQLIQITPPGPQRDLYRTSAQEFVDNKLGEEDLRALADNRSSGELQPVAMYRYALLLAEKHDYTHARRYLEGVQASAPGTEMADHSRQLLTQIDSRNKVDNHTIGVILPLSGKQAAIGYKTLHGIQLGLGIYGKSGSNFRLAIIDSEGNADAGRRGVERLVAEDNVIAIIGGLLSKTATAEAAKAQEFGVPFITLSQKAGVTQIGDEVFRNALTSQMQVQQIVDVAMNQMKMSKFAILYPNDAYGVEYANLFWDEVRAHGGSIQGAQPYDSNETDFRGHVQRLVGLFYLEDRAEEYRLRLKQYNEKNQKRGVREKNPAIEDILPPIVDFDAIFIPDSAKAVGQIAPTLAYMNVHDVRLLGTNIWNSPALAQRGKNYVENSVFVDSFLNSGKSFQNTEFYDNFKSTFDEEPGIFEVQAYDSALLLRQMISQGEATRVGLTQKLGALKNFPGALGPLSISSTREILRPLTTLTVHQGQIVPLNSQTN